MCVPANTERPKLRLRTEEFDRLARAFMGVDTDVEIAARLKVDTSTLSLIRTGKRYVSSGFVASVMKEMPDVPLDRVFEPIAESAA
jgi:hypothetical protein